MNRNRKSPLEAWPSASFANAFAIAASAAGARAAASVVGVAAVAAVIACSPATSEGPQAADPQRQAQSEYDLARDSFYKGHLREALDHCQRSNKLDDQNAKALYFTAVVYLAFCSTEGMASPDCRLTTAEEFTRKAIKADGEFRDAKNTLGQVLILEKKYEEAIKVLEPLTKDPAYVANYLAWGNYGQALVSIGQVDAGITALRNSVTEPRFCTGHYRLGAAYEKKGDFLAAEKSFSDAVGVPSADCQSLQDAWFGRARVRLKLGKTAEAQGDFARCREIGSTTDTGKECAKLAGGSAPTPVPSLNTNAGPNAAPPPSGGGTGSPTTSLPSEATAATSTSRSAASQ
jgi:Tfp pilus assembly protein PilF